MVRRYVRKLECLVGFVCYCSRLFAPLLFECGIFFMIWGNQMVFGWWMRCDWVCESWFFFLVFSYSQPEYRLTTLFRCLSLLSFACFVHALLFSSLFLLLYRWLNVVQLDVCWACIWANLCWFQFQFSFIDFVKYTMRLNGLIHPIFRVNSHSYVRLVWLVGWARTFAFITLQAVNIQCWKWASKCMSSISAAF